MKKKEYINPEIEIVKLEMHQVLSSTSNPDVTIDQSGSVDADKVEAPSWFGGDDQDW